MPREEEIPAAAAARRGLAPVHFEQVIDHIVSIDDVVSQSTSARRPSPTQTAVSELPCTMSEKEELLAALEIMELVVNKKVPTSSLESDSFRAAVKVLISSSDKSHLLTDDKSAATRYSMNILMAHVFNMYLRGVTDKKQALDEALREKADLEKENKALFEENAALSKRVEVLSEQSAQWKQARNAVEESLPEMQGTSECDAEEELDEEKGVKKRKRSND